MSVQEGPTSGYTKIKVTLLEKVGILRGDLYIQLSANHFVKLYQEGDLFGPADFHRVTQEKQLEYLYLKGKTVQEFVQKYTDQVEQKISENKIPSLKEAIEVNEAVHETLHSMAEDLGLAKETQQLAKTQMRVMLRSVGKSPKLKTFLHKLSKFKGEYLSTHSMATGYLACAIATQFEWGSEATFQKLTLAALLHDIALDNSKHAEILTKKDLELTPLNLDDFEKVQQHCQKAAELVRGFTETPPDVDVIILQHHEAPDGSGFPRGLRHSYISPLASVFSVAHEIADRSVRLGHNYSFGEHLAEMKARYGAFSGYRKILDAITEVFLGDAKKAA